MLKGEEGYEEFIIIPIFIAVILMVVFFCGPCISRESARLEHESDVKNTNACKVDGEALGVPVRYDWDENACYAELPDGVYDLTNNKYILKTTGESNE